MANVEKAEFSAGAAFRVFGTGLDSEGITREPDLSPDHQHKRGELDPGKRPYAHDMWSLKSPLPPDDDLEVHLKMVNGATLESKELHNLIEKEIQGGHLLLEDLLSLAIKCHAFQQCARGIHRTEPHVRQADFLATRQIQTDRRWFTIEASICCIF